MRLTPAQTAALRLALSHGGGLTLGGMDDSGIRRDVVERLTVAGMLRLAGGARHANEFEITPAGRLAVGGQEA